MAMTFWSITLLVYKSQSCHSSMLSQPSMCWSRHGSAPGAKLIVPDHANRACDQRRLGL